MQNLPLLESNSQIFTVDNRLSFNFNDHTNLNLTRISSLTETKSYTPITGCVLEHILTTTDLTNHEKLYYLLADSLALISKNKTKHRSASLPSEDWAIRLGCSRSLIFTMQKSLKKKGYFIINKDWDEIGRNKRNLVIPTLPASVFNHLNEKFPDRVEEHAPYNPLTECKRAYLDRSKLFIKLNYQLLLTITASLYLNPQQKMIWLGFYTRCYKNYMLQGQEDSNIGKYNYNNYSGFSFISSYQELASVYSCNTKHLSKSIRALEELGFIKTQNFYIRKKYSDNDDSCSDTYGVDNNYYENQERQDQSLWKITLSLPNDCILELEKVKDRSNLKLDDIKVTATDNTIDSNLVEDYLMLGGIKFNLSLEQASLLKSAVNDDVDTTSLLSTAYIDSVIEELDKSDNTDSSDAFSKPSLSLETFDNKEEKSDRIKSDPQIAKSALLLNKDLKLKIKDLKSNLEALSKVLFNEFLKRFKRDDCDENVGSDKKEGDREFNIHSELIREKLKILPKDKADKARKFAYSLISKKLATGYAAGLNKHELAKQLIHHAASWKPTKLGSISREKEIDTALSVAWKAIVGGTWKAPLELAKAEVLQYEFRHYRRKYQESGIISNELDSLESTTNKLLKTGFINLKGKIIEEAGVDISCNNAVISKTEENDDSDYNALLDHCENIKLPPYLEDQEYHLSYGYRDHSYMNNDIKERNECLISGTEYREVDITDKDEDRQNNYANQILDLSGIPEKQKYLKVNCLEKNNEMIIKTVNDTEYLFKLKAMEVNEEGETVMTLKHVKLKSFIEEANNAFLNSGSNVAFNGLSDNYLTTNTFSIQNQEPYQINDIQFDSIGMIEKRVEQEERSVQIEQSLNIGFMRQEASKTNIDTALSNILKNIQREVE